MDANVPRRRVQRVLAPWALLGSRQSNLLYGSDNASLAHTSVFFGPFEVSEGSSRVGSSGSNDSEKKPFSCQQEELFTCQRRWRPWSTKRL